MGGYDAGVIVAKFNNHPGQMIPLAILGMGFGFIEYAYCFFMSRRDGVSPFPVWMHAFYLAHDFLYVTIWPQWFGEYRSPVFQAMWIGMVAFNVFEIHALYSAIRNERQEAFGHYHVGPVTVGQATFHVVALTVVSFVLLSTARSFLNDTLMFCLLISTNVVMAIVPALAMFKRRRRVRGSLGLAVFIVLGTIVTFLPQGFGMFTTSDPAYFARPWFFIIGATCLVFAVWHLAFVINLPRSEARAT